MELTAEVDKQELSDFNHLVRIYKQAECDIELAVRRFVVQKDLTINVLNMFLNYLDEND